MKTKLNVFVLTIILILAVSAAYYLFRNFQHTQLEANKKRLIELGVSREKIFWDCFDKKVNEETVAWQNSNDYLDPMKKYHQCEQDKIDRGEFTFGCIGLMPNRPWQLHNEIASKFCSSEADNTEDGQLMRNFRKKVPIEDMTDHELTEIIKTKVSR